MIGSRIWVLMVGFKGKFGILGEKIVIFFLCKIIRFTVKPGLNRHLATLKRQTRNDKQLVWWFHKRLGGRPVTGRAVTSESGHCGVASNPSVNLESSVETDISLLASLLVRKHTKIIPEALKVCKISICHYSCLFPPDVLQAWHRLPGV